MFLVITAVTVGAAAWFASRGDAPEAVAVPSPTPTVKQATVAQWASFIAQQDPQLDDALEAWEDNTCSSLALEYPPCYANFITMQLVAKLLDVQLQNATNHEAAKFIGEPPAEVADLVAQTVDAAHDAAMLAEDPDIETPGVALRFTMALDDLNTAYAGWTPYLGGA